MVPTASKTLEMSLIAECGAMFCGFLALAVALLHIFAAVH
jgi:hypothetical protein